jgi:hypothetical protein
MLIIRQEQIKIFEQAAIKRFEDNLLKHVEEFFSLQCQILGEAQTRKVLRYGIEQAENYGFISERDVCLYINLMFMLGSDFDKDMQLPWVTTILKDEMITDSITRIDRLYDEAMDYLDQVAGVNNEHLQRVLFKIREEPIDNLKQLIRENFENDVIIQLRTLWLQKCKNMGETLLRRLIQEGIKAAKSYHITNERNVAIYIGFMFVRGSAFDKEPQIPWVTTILNDDSIKDQTTKIDLLYKRARAYLKLSK